MLGLLLLIRYMKEAMSPLSLRSSYTDLLLKSAVTHYSPGSGFYFPVPAIIFKIKDSDNGDKP